MALQGEPSTGAHSHRATYKGHRITWSQICMSLRWSPRSGWGWDFAGCGRIPRASSDLSLPHPPPPWSRILKDTVSPTNPKTDFLSWRTWLTISFKSLMFLPSVLVASPWVLSPRLLSHLQRTPLLASCDPALYLASQWSPVIVVQRGGEGQTPSIL